eukprot:7630077-Pyramimonas_sp.AAC.1
MRTLAVYSWTDRSSIEFVDFVSDLGADCWGVLDGASQSSMRRVLQRVRPRLPRHAVLLSWAPPTRSS